MRIVRNIASLRKLLSPFRKKKKIIGFVPTMGYLHEGHAALLRTCRRENDIVVLSIFVNPRQFGPHEDFSSYPRDLKKDEKLAKKENVDIIFYPSEKEMYPDDYLTYVEVPGLTDGLCGKFRPGHFKGVTTIVTKLLNIVAPDVMYVGQKDAQQAAVIKKMALDLNIPCVIKILPTVREPDGLALSSRNSYLPKEKRKEASILYRALGQAKDKIKTGERNSKRIIGQIRSAIRKNSSGRIEYVECADTKTLKPLKKLQGNILIALAVRFGRTRLIDNITVRVK